MRTVAFHTIGCKLNYSETSTLSRQLQEVGYVKQAFDAVADVYVINTCSVTDNADKECRELVRRTLRINPEGIVIITGCYAQLKPKEISEIPGVDLVLGAAEKFNLPMYLTTLLHKNTKGVFHSCDIESLETFNASYSIGDRTRSFLKVQDGCDYSCTYCTIPLARGKSRSSAIVDVLTQAQNIALQGVKEIVLTGVNTGDYGLAIKDKVGRSSSFLELIELLDLQHQSVDRYRISSIEPNLLSDAIIEFVAQSQKFMPHFHVPLQSGSDAVLRLMKRRYLSELYAHKVAKIKQSLPHACIGVDVIVGFPGETTADFQATYDFLNQLPVSYLHVFTYSERPNTNAAMLPNRVPMQVRKERNKILRALSDSKKSTFYNEHLGTTRAVLWEHEHDQNTMHGFTDNYIKITTSLVPQLLNTIDHNVLLQKQLNSMVHGSSSLMLNTLEQTIHGALQVPR